MEAIQETFRPGDCVQQIGMCGLASSPRPLYVTAVVNGTLELSREPDGPPLADVKNQPIHYNPTRFRTVTW